MASKRNLRKKLAKSQCFGKVRHETITGALISLRKVKRTYIDWHLMEAYHCQTCKGFHIGHKPKHFTQQPQSGTRPAIPAPRLKTIWRKERKAQRKQIAEHCQLIAERLKKTFGRAVDWPDDAVSLFLECEDLSV